MVVVAGHARKHIGSLAALLCHLAQVHSLDAALFHIFLDGAPEGTLHVAWRLCKCRIVPQVVHRLYDGLLAAIVMLSSDGKRVIDPCVSDLFDDLVSLDAEVRELSHLNGHAAVMVRPVDEEAPVLVPHFLNLAVGEHVVPAEARG